MRLQDTLGPSHVLYHSASLGTLHLTIFLRFPLLLFPLLHLLPHLTLILLPSSSSSSSHRRDLIWYCSIPEDDSFSTRPGTQFKTKVNTTGKSSIKERKDKQKPLFSLVQGAVAVGFLLFGTSFMFVNSHLTAHTENVKDRVKDLKKIYAMLNLPKLLPLKRKHDIFDRSPLLSFSSFLSSPSSSSPSSPSRHLPQLRLRVLVRRPQLPAGADQGRDYQVPSKGFYDKTI